MTYPIYYHKHSYPACFAASRSVLGPSWLGIGSLLLLSGWIPAQTTALGWLPLLGLGLVPAGLTLAEPRWRRLSVLLGLAAVLLALHGFRVTWPRARLKSTRTLSPDRGSRVSTSLRPG